MYLPAEWTEFANQLDQQGNKKSLTYSFSTIDGDESPVTYSGPLNSSNQIYVRFGKRFGTIRFELFEDGKIVREMEGNKSFEDLQFAKSTEMLTVVLGADEDLLAKIKSAIVVQSPDDETLTVAVTSHTALPTDPLGWDSVNRLIIHPAAIENVAEMDPAIWDAIDQWVKSGGDLTLIAAPDQPDLFLNDDGIGGKLKKLIPGTPKGVWEMKNSRELERFVGTSQRQLIGRDDEPLKMLEIEPDADAITVASSDDHPVLVRSAHGFGRISFCSLDLSDRRLMEWPSYASLLEKVIAEDDTSSSLTNRQETGRSKEGLAHYGYSDLLGQLRVPLDDFSEVRFLPFTLIAALITLYILCVAVGDYFFLNKVLKKMELTWITFPLIALLFCSLAFGISVMTRPADIQINQMEIIDIDLIDGASRGTAWVNIYAPTAEKIDVELESKTAFDLDIGQQIVSWQGLPGDGLGGMDNEVSTGFKQLAYEQTFTASSEGEFDVSLKQLPLQVASTKPLLIQYKVAAPENFSSQLSVGRGRLEGTFKNPLDVTIYNGRIFFGDYVYLLKKPLLPDVVTLIESNTKERTLSSHLKRNTAGGVDGNEAGRSKNSPWDPQEKNLTRIADVMMFYEAAGGQGYTGLTNGYHREIDFSKLLRLGKAVLVGQIESGSRIKINGADVSDRYDSNITMIRILLPVDK